jgi:hypothetical protein
MKYNNETLFIISITITTFEVITFNATREAGIWFTNRQIQLHPRAGYKAEFVFN